MSNPAVLPAIMGLSSWIGDIAERLARKAIVEDQALAEMEQRRGECIAEIERARMQNLSDRALLDEAARRKFASVAAPSVETPPIATPTEPPHA